MSIFVGYKLRKWVVDCGHRHTRPKNLGKGGETVLPALWFCTILSSNPIVRHRIITEQIA